MVMQLRSSVSSYDLKNVMSWGVFFFFFNLGISWALFAQMPFIHSLCETYWGLRSVRSALQESDLLIYRPLIRLALWRFHQANDEISLFLCLSSVSLPSPPPATLYQYSIPHWPPSITTPCSQVMMQFMGSVLLPYIATEAPPQVLFELRVYRGLIINWTVSLPSLHNAVT